MFKSVRVGSIFGIPIKLDITLLIVLPAFTWLIGARITEIAGILSDVPRLSIDVAAISGGLMPWILGLAAAIGLFVGVTLHELGHSVVAIRYGYAIDSITLWLLGGLAQFTEQPREWTHEFWIAIAGPIVSVAIGVVSYLAVVILPSGLNAVSFVLGYLAVLNVTLAVFNMIPAFPLDGGRVLRALYHRSTTLARATEKAVRVGKVFAVILGIFGLLTFNIFMIAVAFFIYMAGSAEGRHTAIASVFEDVAVIEVMTPASEVTSVRPGLSVADLFDRMLDDRYSGYPVVEDGDIVGISRPSRQRIARPSRYDQSCSVISRPFRSTIPLWRRLRNSRGVRPVDCWSWTATGLSVSLPERISPGHSRFSKNAGSVQAAKLRRSHSNDRDSLPKAGSFGSLPTVPWLTPQ